MPDSSISSAGVACPRCGKIHTNRAELDTLIPDQPTDWPCRSCGQILTITKVQPSPVYMVTLAKQPEVA